MGGAEPKQYRGIAGRCAVARCLETLAAAPEVERVLTVVRPADVDRFRAAKDAAGARLSSTDSAKILDPVAGGAERQDSVRLGLDHLATLGRPDLVVIHDAARPFLPREVLTAAIEAARDCGGACVAEPLADTLRA